MCFEHSSKSFSWIAELFSCHEVSLNSYVCLPLYLEYNGIYFNKPQHTTIFIDITIPCQDMFFITLWKTTPRVRLCFFLYSLHYLHIKHFPKRNPNLSKTLLHAFSCCLQAMLHLWMAVFLTSLTNNCVMFF